MLKENEKLFASKERDRWLFANTHSVACFFDIVASDSDKNEISKMKNKDEKQWEKRWRKVQGNNNDLIQTEYDIDPIAKPFRILIFWRQCSILMACVVPVLVVTCENPSICAMCIITLNQVLSKQTIPFGLFWCLCVLLKPSECFCSCVNRFENCETQFRSKID